MEDEIFKTITNFNNYEISNLGNIKQKGRDIFIKKFVFKKYGYHFIDLINSDNQTITLPVKRLVAKHFFTDFNDRKHIIHIDSKLDDNINNIKYRSPKKYLQKINRSGIKGVSFCEYRKKWIVTITINNKRFYLGCFDNIEDAKIARINKENELKI